MFFSNRLIGYKFKEQLEDVCPAVLFSAIMGIAVYMMSFINLNKVLVLIIQIIVGGIIYIVLSRNFKLNAYEYMMAMVKKSLTKVSREGKN